MLPTAKNHAPKGGAGTPLTPIRKCSLFVNQLYSKIKLRRQSDLIDVLQSDDEVNHDIIGVVMAQHFSLKAGLEKLGVPGEKATTKELTQLHTMVTFIPMDPAKLTRADRLKALSSLVLLIKK